MPIDPTLPFASGSSGSEISKLEPDYADAFNAYRQGPTQQTRGALLKAVDPVINTAIKSHGGPSKGSPMLKSQARQMAIRAFESYDPNRGALKTHLLSQLRGLQRHAHRQNQIIRMPEQVGLDRMHLQQAEQELADRLGREPSDAQVADHTGLSLKRIAHIRQGQNPVATGSVLDQMAQENHAMPASQIPGVDQAGDGWEEFVYYDLGDTDRLIFDHMLGKHGKKPKTPAQIAQMLGVSQSAISQRAKRIQGMLDERYESELFE